MNNVVTHLKLFSVAVIWGLGWPAGRVVANDILPFAASWLRYVIATVSFLIFMQMSGQWMFPNRSEWRRIITIGFISTVMYQAFFMFGMQFTAAGDASLMITFNPLFTAILAVVFISERMHLNLIIGLFMGITGVAILFYYSPNVDLPFSERVLGNMLIACAALSWACNTILMKRAMTSPANAATKPLNPLELTVWSSVAGLLILTPITVSRGDDSGRISSQPEWLDWNSILGLILNSYCLCMVCRRNRQNRRINERTLRISCSTIWNNWRLCITWRETGSVPVVCICVNHRRSDYCPTGQSSDKQS